jgi:hypothetical protein
MALPTNQSSVAIAQGFAHPAGCWQSLLGLCSSLAVEALPDPPRISTELLRLNLDE